MARKPSEMTLTLPLLTLGGWSHSEIMKNAKLIESYFFSHFSFQMLQKINISSKYCRMMQKLNIVSIRNFVDIYLSVKQFGTLRVWLYKN